MEITQSHLLPMGIAFKVTIYIVMLKGSVITGQNVWAA